MRYMDDFLLLTRLRWQLRQGIARLAEYFDTGGFERHPDKTQTGRVCSGFDWLGIWFGSAGVSIAAPGIKQPSRTARAAL
ncbi:MAG: transposase [Proteobacteria bacterium]|nr:transposase [Pseudomonadota bacterium]